MFTLTRINPFALSFYFLVQIVIIMIFFNPILVVIGLLTAIVLSIMSSGAKGIILYLLFFLVIAITNPIFSHNGMTPLFYVNSNAITLEAIIYGLIMGGVVLAVFYNIKNFNAYITPDKLIYIIGKFTPKIALLISMVLNFVPMIVSKGKDIYSCQKLLVKNDKNIIKKLKLLITVVSCVISQMLENGVITSDSMSARGYGTVKRTSSIKRKFKRSDMLFVVVTLVLASVVFVAGANNVFYFYCYPKISTVKTDLFAIIAYSSFFILSIMPIIIFVIGELKWKYLISKI